MSEEQYISDVNDILEKLEIVHKVESLEDCLYFFGSLLLGQKVKIGRIELYKETLDRTFHRLRMLGDLSNTEAESIFKDVSEVVCDDKKAPDFALKIYNIFLQKRRAYQIYNSEISKIEGEISSCENYEDKFYKDLREKGTEMKTVRTKGFF